MKEATRSLIRDYGGTIAIAVTVALIIRVFIIEAYRFPTAAMRPTLEPGDTIFVGKWAALLGGDIIPSRGDVILFSFPSEARRDYIKRVIGLPNEAIQVKQGHLSINGRPVGFSIPKNSACGTETLPGGKTYPVCWEPPLVEDFGPEKIPEDSVFAIGDSRAESATHNWAVVPFAAVR